jgi:hypothetical protein
MICFRFACSVFAFLFFFGEAKAQDNLEIRLKECPMELAPNDPSIRIQKTVRSTQDCTASAAEIRIHDDRYGSGKATKTVGNLSSPGWTFEPSHHDVFITHKPCVRRFPDRGKMIEWLVPLDRICDGRDPGWYYRVYTKEKVCVMPGEICTYVHDPAELPKQRFDATVWIAYFAK